MAGMCACGRYPSQCVAPHCDRLDPRSGRSDAPAERGQRVSAETFALICGRAERDEANGEATTMQMIALDARARIAELDDLQEQCRIALEESLFIIAQLEREHDRLAAENAGLRAQLAALAGDQS